MRIAVSQADLDSGRFSSIARALAKAWPIGKLSLMQAQGVLSQALGYRSLHDLQQVAQARLLSPPMGLTRVQISDAVAWKLSRLAPMPLRQARELSRTLRLSMLDVDACTPEAAFEAQQKKAAESGRMLILDEMDSLLTEDWHVRTPDLLDWGAPPFRFAVLPNRRAFSWFELTSLLDSLPAGFEDDLLSEGSYQGQSGNALLSALVSRELLPQAFSPLPEYIKRHKKLPSGFSIKWLYNSDRRVQGRVIHNWILGGIVPVVFDARSDAIFEALANIMCGGVVPVPVAPADGERSTVFATDEISAGFHLTEETEQPESSGLWSLHALGTVCVAPEHSLLEAGEKGYFIESGQSYVRSQEHMFMAPADIPAWFSSRGRIGAALAAWPDNPGSSVVPSGVDALSTAAADVLQSLKDQAQAASQLWTPEVLVQISQSIASPEALDRYLAQHPFVQDDADVARLTTRGQSIKNRFSVLQSYADSTVGSVWSRAGDDFTDISALCGLVVCSAFCAEACDPEEADSMALEDEGVLLTYLIMTSQVKVGEGRIRSFDLERLAAAVSRVKSSLKRIGNWRDEQEADAKVRAEGQFLYVESAVSREKPRSFQDWYNMMRSHNHKPVSVVQDATALDSKRVAHD